MTPQTNNNDVKFLDRNPPQIPESEARQVALDLYGLSGDFKPLESERDQNYRIKTDDGRRFVLKMTNVDEDPDVIYFQIKALQYIEQQEPLLPVPRVVKNKNDDDTDFFETANGNRHIVYVLTFLSGTTLEESPPPSPLMLRNLGNLLARTDISLRGFFHSHARHELIWDTMRCLGLRRHTDKIKDPVTRQNVETIFDHMEKDILPKLKGLRQQVIHGDATSINVLTDPAIPDSITGLIDFGDLIYAPLVIEVANAVDNENLGTEGYLDALVNVAVGFDSVLPLEEEEIDLLYDLVLVRQAITTSIVAWRRVMCPGQPGYLQDYEATTGKIIAGLMATGREKAINKLRDACRFPPYCPDRE
ncbi:MAG: phosphotransferase [Desulfobacterales bacterium]|nr:phosphotransferase [Desulfobacterales bacterium]